MEHSPFSLECQLPYRPAMASFSILRVVFATLLLCLGRSSASHQHHEHTHQLEARATPSFAYNVLWGLHKSFWDAFIYPNNVKQAQAVNSTLLAPNVIGRVDVCGVEDNGLCRSSETITDSRRTIDHQGIHWTGAEHRVCECKKPE